MRSVGLLSNKGHSETLPYLEAIGRDIAHRCGGVPLVATVIGGTMCNKWDRVEWLSLTDSSLWGSLEKNDQGNLLPFVFVQAL
ncbi:hypothetical protein V6N13_024062 [Hibiscus sabdariffa]|uniref:NB-ARC domain-containing protein n=1 Tax=Hibiscus sabdariffa TaxID=183260 RepID=A0ABR2BWI6_9ROSI